MTGLAWTTFPNSTSPTWWPFAWTAYFGVCGGLPREMFGKNCK